MPVFFARFIPANEQRIAHPNPVGTRSARSAYVRVLTMHVLSHRLLFALAHYLAGLGIDEVQTPASLANNLLVFLLRHVILVRPILNLGSRGGAGEEEGRHLVPEGAEQ